MASTFITLARPFSSHKPHTPSPSKRLLGLRSSALKINAIAKKWEPTKVVPQADRVLIRLQELPEDKSFSEDACCLFSICCIVLQENVLSLYLSCLYLCPIHWHWVEKSSGGVLLPKSAVKFERYLMGEILSVGAEVGEVEAGKKVLFSDINAYEVDLGTDGRHCFCKESDLLAVVE
ncbi:10 kDa chaperonin 1, chloroplastic [Vitis vinifera]|uniref:10 kDa chaperonin 1, chloroplastic n=1 Tax=Vitis vinifera TaxID=29760 RepID=A0A438FGE7_VITVI|nr:10 kDa chaperonin 1, chloroplastic [Vitis vinifera]